MMLDRRLGSPLKFVLDVTDRVRVSRFEASGYLPLQVFSGQSVWQYRETIRAAVSSIL
jgi:hypothetical protein